MRVIDRELAKTIAGFGSTTRANNRLLMLTRSGILRRFFFGTIAGGRKAMYTLSTKGQRMVDAASSGVGRKLITPVVGDLFLEHQMTVNEIYATVKFGRTPDGVRIHRWLTFRGPLASSTPLIPDGYFEVESSGQLRAVFLEADLGTETLRVWQRKVSEYLKFASSGKFAQVFRLTQFRVVVLTTSEKRLENIRAIVRHSTDKIFWFSTFQSINRDGFWSPVWARPVGDQKVPLL
jgi:hypothetical protein